MPKQPPPKVYPKVPPGMEKTSFKLYDAAQARVFPRLIIAADGHQKSGKSNFALSAPRQPREGTKEGLFLFHADMGLEGVGHKFVDPGKGPLYKADYFLDVRELEGAGEDEVKKAAAPIAKRFWADVERAVALNCRSMVFDSASELYEYDRLAEWGKLQMKAHHYTPINAKWKRLFKILMMSKCNAVLLHRLTQEWKDDKPTDNFRRQGYTKTGFEVQMNVTCWRETSGKRAFHVTVEDSRHEADLAGMDLEGEECNFPTLAGRVFPDIDPEFWD